MVQTHFGKITDRPNDAGVRVGIRSSDVVRPLSAGGGAQKVSTITVDTQANSTVYAYSCGGGAVTYTSDASATKVEIAAGLAEAHNTLTASSTAAFAVSDGVDTVTITGREINGDFAVSEADGNLTLAAVTAASDGSPIPFGIGVAETAFGVCGLPGAGTAQVDTLTPAPVHNALYSVTVSGDFEQDGVYKSYSATYQADGTTDAGEISVGLVIALNNMLPANSVLASGTTTVVLTAENPGVGFATTAGGDLTAATIAIVNTTANSAPLFAGIAQKSQRIETSTADAAEYSANDIVNVLSSGECTVLLDAGQTPASGDPVYWRGTAGAGEQLGAFRSSPDGDDAHLIPGASWTGAAYTALDGTSLVATLTVRA